MGRSRQNVRQKEGRRAEWVPRLLLAAAVAAYAIYFSYLTLTRYAAFEARALDLGNLNQTIWNTAHGNWFHMTNQPGTVNRFSLHVEPILLPVAAIYRLLPDARTLLALQSVVVGLGALPLYALARRLLGSAWAGLAFGVAFLLNPSMQAANWLEFHPITLAPTFLLACFWYLVVGSRGQEILRFAQNDTDTTVTLSGSEGSRRRATWLFVLFAVLAAACKEEVALLIFMIGLYAALALRRVWLGIVTMALSLAWALIAVLGIQNAFADGNIHWGRYGYLGESPGEMALALVTRPGLVWEQLQAAGALRYVAELLFPVGFVGALGPEALLMALPSLAINLLADFSPMHQVYTLIYAAPIVPFVLIAAVLGTRRAARWAERRGGVMAGRAATVGAVALVLAGALVTQQFHGYLPGGGNHRLYTVTEHDRRAAAILAQIPADAKVSAQDKLNPHVSGRETIYIFPRINDADTVLLDVTGPAWPQHPADVRASVEELLAGEFGVAAAADGYLLLRKGGENKSLPEEFYSAWQTQSETERVRIDFAAEGEDMLRLVDYRVTTDDHGEIVTTLAWEALRPLAEDYGFWVAYLDEEWNVLYDTEFYPPVASLWYPTAMWMPGETVRVETLPWTVEADRFTLALGVYSGGRWSEGRRLAVTHVESSQEGPTLPRFEGDSWVRLGGYERTDDGWAAIDVEDSSPQVALDAVFGDSIALEGVSGLETSVQAGVRAGEVLSFSLHWRGLAEMDREYTVFAQLLDADSNRVAQIEDRQPRDAIGRLPTSAWQAGEPVVDRYALPLPAELSPGEYRLVAGLYSWQDGSRLPVAGADAGPGDVAEVAIVRVISE